MTHTLVRRPAELWRSLFGRDLPGLFEPFFDDEEMMGYREVFLPPVDVFHDDEKITIRVEAPGVRKEDLDVHVEGDLLLISGKKEHVPSENYHQVESRCGTFSRTITLPHTVEREKIGADYKDGVLMITLPLTPESKPKQITINVK